VERQNITLSLPKSLLKRVKHLAAEKNSSVSELLTQFLADLVEREETYQKAKKEHLALLEEGFELGTDGSINWKRVDLHDR